MTCDRNAAADAWCSAIRRQPCSGSSAAPFYLGGFWLCARCAREFSEVAPELTPHICEWPEVASMSADGVSLRYELWSP